MRQPTTGVPREALPQGMFLVERWTHMLKGLLRRSTEALEIAARFRQAQSAVRPTPDLIGIVHVLAIVLPEAHRATLVTTSLLQSHIVTAGASVWASTGESMRVEEAPLGHGRDGRTSRTGIQPHPLPQAQACGFGKRDPAINEPWCGCAA